jgi:protocatechuate 3,4-dioxygenase beta subunit
LHQPAFEGCINTIDIPARNEDPVHSDDQPVGRILSRREILASLGAASAAIILPFPSRSGRLVLPNGTTLPACVVRPAQTEGPYFVDEKLDRSDIRSDPSNGKVSEGALLDLTIRLSQVSGASCVPLAGAVVDIWQCDAHGVYSDVKDIDGQFNTVGQKFLRGHQVSNKDGDARFKTVYPGWYPGRSVHIHFKVRTNPSGSRGTEFTSQLYFDDAFSDTVFTEAPYARRGERTRNGRDGIFQRQGGPQLVLDVARAGAGYASTFEIGLS